ncbi:MAG: peptidyl-prolyl cis-trans isomerase [Candidatus Cloacimonetes bacterium]|nr:peptidyl-prolyl cis-trans isomerase [Candidatus Cloacimonadota bacterium]
MKQNNNPLIFTLIFILFVIQLSQIFQLPFLPKAPHNLKQADQEWILSQVEEKLPILVQKEIGFQIHELVMDKIKLNEKITTAKSKLVNSSKVASSVLKIGNSIVDKELFQTKLKSFAEKPENKAKAKVDLKNSLVSELHKHYAVIESCKREDMQKSKDFLYKLQRFQQKVFLSELIRNKVKTISPSDVEKYYQDNLSLYEKGEAYSFVALQSEKREDLMKVSSVDLFDQSALTKSVFKEKQDSVIPYSFMQALNTLKPNQLSPVLRYNKLFFILKKTKEQQKFYTPFTEVLPFIQKHLTHSRIRNFLQKTSNPIRFKYSIKKTDSSYTIDGKDILDHGITIAKEILPPAFLGPIINIPEEKSLLNLQLSLIFKELSENPSHFDSYVTRQTSIKTSEYKEILLIQSKRDQLFQAVKVSEQEIKDFYTKNPNRFIQTKGELSSHIFVSNRSKALEVLNLSLMDSNNFAALAKQHSEESKTAQFGGDMRYLDKKSITPEMNAAVKTLSEGEVYPKLIESTSKKGFHILKFEKTLPTEVVSFDKVKDKLRQWITEKKQALSFSEFISKAIKKYPIQVDQNELASI